MSCAHDRAVMLVIEGSATEINKPNVCPFHALALLSLEKNHDSFKHVITTVKHDHARRYVTYEVSNFLLGVYAFVVRIDEQYIFWFQIGVREFVVVQKFDGVAKLVSDMPDVFQWIRLVLVISL